MEALTIIKKHIPKSQYKVTKVAKKVIILHHTAGGSAQSAINTWLNDPTPVATEFIIDRDGQVYQIFPEGNWAYALGLKNFAFRDTWESQAVQIELVAGGFLEKKADNSFYSSALKKTIPNNEVECLDEVWRGCKYFHAYTANQIQSLEKLLHFINERDAIPLKLDAATLFDDKSNLLKNKKPFHFAEQKIYTHANFRSDKTDCYPSQRLIEMLQTIDYETH